MKSWEGYVLRLTYVAGNYKGKSYIYIKEGFVRDDSKDTLLLPDDCYQSERAAKIVASRYSNSRRHELRMSRELGIAPEEVYTVVKVIDGHIQN